MNEVKLKGTDKQIKWATDIRAQKMKDILAAEEQLKSIAEAQPDDEVLQAECAPIFEIIEAMKKAETAEFWINSREYDFADLNNYLQGYLFAADYKAGYIK